MEEVPDLEEKNYREFYVSGIQKGQFADNSIHTTKCNGFIFPFRFLYYQFSKLTNLIFIIVIILLQIPGISPVGKSVSFIPLTIILVISAIKELVEDINRRRSDAIINNQKCEIFTDKWNTHVWRDIMVGSIVKILSDQIIPADVILIDTSESSKSCHVLTSDLDGETNFKLKQASNEFINFSSEDQWRNVKATIKCENPNHNLNTFNGLVSFDGSRYFRINNNQLILRGSQLTKCDWAIGIAIYTGKESKIMLNTSIPKFKTSFIEYKVHQYVLMLLILVLIISLTTSIIHFNIFTKVIPHHWYLNPEIKTGFTFIKYLITSFILFHDIIPITLVAVIELNKLFYCYSVGKDTELYSNYSKVHTSIKNSSVIEDLGIVNYVFTDKTGTLTKKEMSLKLVSVGSDRFDLGNVNDCKLMKIALDKNEQVKLLMTALLLCNTITIEFSNNGETSNYYSLSNDEISIIKSLETNEIIFINRTPPHVHIRINGIDEVWTILHTFEFSSDRMRMSVIVKSSNDKIYLFVKGADNVINKRLSTKEDDIYKSTSTYLEEFSQKSLRTLCIAYKPLSSDEYKYLSTFFESNHNQLLNIELIISRSSEYYENNLILLGCIGIENKLQDRVPETIESLKQANINIWMCTGDKLQTSIKVGFSCGILTKEMDIQILSCNNTESCLVFLKNLATDKNIPIHKGKKRRPNPYIRLNLALLFTSAELVFAQESDCISIFIDILIHCKAVICCRLSPFQKQNILLMLKESVKDVVILAIGDGSNDCGMIQASHIGVGISGKDGTKAVNFCDIVIGEFSHLINLLFIHGTDTFRRLSNCIFFCFYKNIFISIVNMFYNFHCMHSNLNIFNRVHLMLYNIFYTSLLIFCFGILEEYCSRQARNNLPCLYASLRNSNYFGFKRFLGWVGNAILHSFGVFYLCYLICNPGVINSDGAPINLAVFSTLIYTHIILVVTLKAALEIRSWSILIHIGIWNTFLIYLIYNTLVCRKALAFKWLQKHFLDSDMLLLKSYIFWASIFIPIIVLLPDLLFHVIRNTFFIPYHILISEIERSKQINWSNKNEIEQFKEELLTLKGTNNRIIFGGFIFRRYNRIKKVAEISFPTHQ